MEGEPAVDKIRVLIASNNQTYREALTFSLSQEGDIHIIGEVLDSVSVVKKTEQLCLTWLLSKLIYHRSTA